MRLGDGISEGRGRGVVCGARVGRRGRGRLAVDFHVLPQGAGVCVCLVTAPYFAVVRLVTRVDVGVLLPVTTVGKFPVTTVKLTFERFLPWKRWKHREIKFSCINDTGY